jgi:hypothetical protein
MVMPPVAPGARPPPCTPGFRRLFSPATTINRRQSTRCPLPAPPRSASPLCSWRRFSPLPPGRSPRRWTVWTPTLSVACATGRCRGSPSPSSTVTLWSSPVATGCESWEAATRSTSIPSSPSPPPPRRSPPPRSACWWMTAGSPGMTPSPTISRVSNWRTHMSHGRSRCGTWSATIRGSSGTTSSGSPLPSIATRSCGGRVTSRAPTGSGSGTATTTSCSSLPARWWAQPPGPAGTTSWRRGSSLRSGWREAPAAQRWWTVRTTSPPPTTGTRDDRRPRPGATTTTSAAPARSSPPRGRWRNGCGCT